ncbi:MAG: helix-turn-helix domain-containing protein [Actinomycetota bacterium]|nr:helix-turn-helix domain-containing protein [Actinomycetota bacterium]MDQ2959102.1 helix-turn-helix domain-containing protein [Actinomycetota bacterium]
MSWRQALADEGVTVNVIDAHHVQLIDEESSASSVVLLRDYRRPLSSSKVPPLGERAGLLVVPHGSEVFFRTARQVGWWIATEDGELDIAIGSRHILRRHEEQPVVKQRPGRKPWPFWTTVRVLTALAASAPPGGSVTQEFLAQIVGTSQPTIYRAVRRLSEHGLLEIARGRIQATDLDALIDWWLQNYPGPGGVTGYWYSLATPAEQTRDALALLGASRGNAAPVVSGQVAADLLAPWQRSGSVQLYTCKAVPLAAAGFVPVATAEAATLCLTVPADTGIWPRSPWSVTLLGTRVGLADPLQILYDVGAAAGPTASEARDRLRAALRTTLADSWRQTRTQVMP